jgi:hypothetical protein
MVLHEIGKRQKLYLMGSGCHSEALLLKVPKNEYHEATTLGTFFNSLKYVNQNS